MLNEGEERLNKRKNQEILFKKKKEEETIEIQNNTPEKPP